MVADTTVLKAEMRRVAIPYGDTLDAKLEYLRNETLRLFALRRFKAFQKVAPSAPVNRVRDARGNVNAVRFADAHRRILPLAPRAVVGLACMRTRAMPHQLLDLFK
jgi:hypothetical protein